FSFATLPDEDEGAFLLDRFQISYLSTGPDVLRYRDRPPEQAAAPLILADPAFDLPLPGGERLDGGRRTPHPGRREARYALAAMRGVRPVLRGESTFARLLECRSPRLLHLSTHAAYEDLRGSPGARLEFPAAALAGANAALREGYERIAFLTAGQVGEMDLT